MSGVSGIQDIFHRMSTLNVRRGLVGRWFSTDSDSHSDHSDTEDTHPSGTVDGYSSDSTLTPTSSPVDYEPTRLIPTNTPPRPSSPIITLYEEMFSDNSLDLVAVERALKACTPVTEALSIEDRDHYNLLHKAIIFDSVELVKLLLRYGLDVNFAGDHESCNISVKCPHNNLGALHLASFLGRVEIVSLLLIHGSDWTARRRVYTSAVIHCPVHIQPSELCREQPDYIVELLTRCGNREPIFYGVLGDHVTIVEMFLQQETSELQAHANLLSLACRVGSFHCLEYLVKLFPDEINKFDSDGLPPLLMSMKHGVRLVLLLLRQNADVTTLDDMWETGSNVLHFLFKALPVKDVHSSDLKEVIKLCIQGGAKVNAKRQPSCSTPLHDLMSAVNTAYGVDFRNLQKRSVNADILAAYDQSINEAVMCMVVNGADINSLDSNGKSPVNLLLLNENFSVRCGLSVYRNVHSETREALKVNNFGVDNNIKNLKLFIECGGNVAVNDYGMTPLCDFIEVIKSSHFRHHDMQWSDRTCPHLYLPEVVDGYTEVLRLLLGGGCDPNQCPPERLPPLLHLLSHCTDHPYEEGHVMSSEAAKGMAKLVRLLLENGAKPECEVGTRRRLSRVVGGFDLLMAILETMQDYPHDRTVDDLRVLITLALPLLQYGARAVVYHKLLYGDPGNLAEVPWCYYMPNHSFLYQVLQFGALNLQFVNDGDNFIELTTILCNHVDHYTLLDVVCSLNTQFQAMHDAERCSCGRCQKFGTYLATFLRKPRRLKHICRLAILNHIHVGTRWKAVQNISLPVSLQEYLLLFLD